METQAYPELVRRLPEAEIPWPGLRAWFIGNEHGQVAFFECDEPVEVGEHSHGAQFIAVLDGELKLMIEGEEKTLRRGATCYIPSGAKHSALLSVGYKSIEIFEDADRFKAKQ